MGFFSWCTADTKESIPNIHSGRKVKTVFLLQPGGEKHIIERAYDGYGIFGSVDAYEWLARANASHYGFSPECLSSEALINLGISIDLGQVFFDKITGDFWHIFTDARKLIPGKFFSGTFDQYIPELQASANNLSESGRFEQFEIKAVKGLPYPLKFSFNEKSVYEHLPASESCPYLGFFFDDN